MGTTRSRRLSVALFAVVLPLLLYGAYRGSAPSMQDLSADGDEFVAAIEQFRSRHGHYPDSPAAAGVELPTTRYGPWRYRASDDRSSFDLSVGDYRGLDPFTLYWMSANGRWTLDQ